MFIKASQSENNGMYVYNFKNWKTYVLRVLRVSTEKDSEGLDIQRLKTIYHPGKCVSTIFETFFGKIVNKKKHKTFNILDQK